MVPRPMDGGIQSFNDLVGADNDDHPFRSGAGTGHPVAPAVEVYQNPINGNSIHAGQKNIHTPLLSFQLQPARRIVVCIPMIINRTLPGERVSLVWAVSCQQKAEQSVTQR